MKTVCPTKLIEHSMPTIGIEEQKALVHVCKSHYVSEGPRTKKFEKDLAAFLHVDQALCLPSGFLALFLSVVALGGDQSIVYMPSFVCREVYDAVRMAGAEAVICDIGEDFNISLSDVKKKISRKTRKKKILMLAHMFGLPADLDSFLALDIPIIEDCANSIGATYKGNQTGTMGDIGMFSFEATKMMTTGQGGALVSRRKKIMDKIIRLKYETPLKNAPRYNFFFTDVQSSIGIVQLQKLNSFIKNRKSIAQIYFKKFKMLPVMLPKQYPGRDHIFFRFMIGSTKIKPEQSMHQSLQKGFKIKQVVPALHRGLGLQRKDFPMTEMALKQWVSIPIHPSLSRKDVSIIVKGMQEIFHD
jgi:dTDP-4-amino-4,6-dideoxygalactose transaminase